MTKQQAQLRHIARTLQEQGKSKTYIKHFFEDNIDAVVPNTKRQPKNQTNILDAIDEVTNN